MKSGGAIIFFITQVEWNGMEAIGGARAYGVVVCMFARTVGRPQDAPSFRHKKGNAVQYNVVLVHVSSDATKRIELNEIGPSWNLTGGEGRGCVRLGGACVRGITDGRRRPTDRPFNEIQASEIV
jgi:hypothetical protein